MLVGWWLRVPEFVGFQTKQIWDLQTMLYHPAKVPSLGLALSLDSPWPYCVVCTLENHLTSAALKKNTAHFTLILWSVSMTPAVMLSISSRLVYPEATKIVAWGAIFMASGDGYF